MRFKYEVVSTELCNWGQSLSALCTLKCHLFYWDFENEIIKVSLFVPLHPAVSLLGNSALVFLVQQPELGPVQISCCRRRRPHPRQLVCNNNRILKNIYKCMYFVRLDYKIKKAGVREAWDQVDFSRQGSKTKPWGIYFWMLVCIKSLFPFTCNYNYTTL